MPPSFTLLVLPSMLLEEGQHVHFSLEMFVGLLLVMSFHLHLVTQGDFQSSEGQFDSEEVFRDMCKG